MGLLRFDLNSLQFNLYYSPPFYLFLLAQVRIIAEPLVRRIRTELFSSGRNNNCWLISATAR